jgi:hypothetical protein
MELTPNRRIVTADGSYAKRRSFLMPLSELGRSMDAHSLTEPQRRHIAVFLQQVEEALDEVESLAATPTPGRRIFRVDVNDLPEGFGNSIEPEVLRIRAGLRSLVEQLGLESHPRSRARQVQSLILTTLVQVEDTGSRGLRGYGPLGSVVFSIIDPALTEIHHDLERIAQLAAGPRSMPGVPAEEGS